MKGNGNTKEIQGEQETGFGVRELTQGKMKVGDDRVHGLVFK